MPDTLTPDELAEIREDVESRTDQEDVSVPTARALLAHIDALTAAVRALPKEYDTGSGASMRAAVLAILRGEQ